MILAIAIITGVFLYNQSRFKGLVKNINKTLSSSKIDARLLEVRSLLTNVTICETTLKGLAINQTTEFTLKTASGAIAINFPGDQLTVKKLVLVPYQTSFDEIMSGQINVTLLDKSNNQPHELVVPLFYNFIIDNNTKIIKECLGEKTEESVELYKTTLAQKRKEICTDALHGTIQNGKCVWPW